MHLYSSLLVRVHLCLQIPRLAGSTHGFIFEVLKAHAPPASTSAAWHWALHSGALHAEGLEAGAVPAQEVLMTGMVQSAQSRLALARRMRACVLACEHMKST